MEDDQPVVCVDLHRAMSIEPGAMCIEPGAVSIEPGAVSIEPARMSKRFAFWKSVLEEEKYQGNVV